ncbi:F-box/FBD/LRR-repeat protein At1g13570-like [Punica granatum]|uniref:F-box/FBD/LRR-repeat protein At1g13570-like n=1 Tax=Punica granatum TaxID=22663 RepID=A0A6P8E138_PUNGR|nr:F-box/FBD/LRR-repeat protein At1g13570-like [Punica granatum]
MAAGTEHPSSGRNWARRRDSKPSLEEEDQDRISCLPLDLIEMILRRLPLWEAVRTSVLSRRWRYAWTTLMEIVLDESCAPSPSQYKSVTDRLVKIIDNILSLHRGPMEKFVLSHGQL